MASSRILLLLLGGILTSACELGQLLDATDPDHSSSVPPRDGTPEDPEVTDPAGAPTSDGSRTDAGSDPSTVDCQVESVGQAPIRLLTRMQYASAVRDMFAPLAIDAEAFAARLPQDIEAFGFETNAGASVDDTRLGQLFTAVEDISQQVFSRFAELMPCVPSRVCAQQFLQKYGRRAFRRPLNATEQEALLALWDKGPDNSERVRGIVEALLLSPETLYQVESGELIVNERRLTPYELATKLSLLLWNTIPDDVLLDAAAEGELGTDASLTQTFERMFGDPRARAAIGAFHMQWLDIAESANKSAELFPDFPPAVYGQALEETRRFVEDVVFEGGSFEDLLLSNKAFVRPALAGIYGLTSTQAGVQQVALDPTERAGILTRVAFLASTSGEERTSVTLRGVALRDKLLCQTIPEPPAALQDVFPLLPDDPNLTAKELIALHQVEPVCAGCHTYIDPLGLLFENFDAIGRHRTSYSAGAIVESSAELVPLVDDGSDLSGTLSDALALSRTLAESDRARACYADHLFRFGLLREVTQADQCAFDHMIAQFYRGDLSLKALFRSLVLSPAFRLRSK